LGKLKGLSAAAAILKGRKFMSLADKKHAVLMLKYIGEDAWSRPVYQDQFARLWKDIELGDGDQPSLYSVVGDEFDGEPNMPIKQEFIIQPVDLPDKTKKFQYQMLDRMRSDCDYYLGYGNRYPGHLSEKSEKKHIEAMKAMWLSFSEGEKPEWLTWEQILEYEKQMCAGQ
jgi:hypothetical protein